MAKGKKTGGRRPGSKNKTTATLKEMILTALHKRGGAKYLESVSDAVFCSLVAKLLPQEVTGKDGGGIKHKVTVVVKSDREFFGRSRVPHLTAGAIAPSDPGPEVHGAIQNGCVRPALGEDDVGTNGVH